MLKSVKEIETIAKGTLEEMTDLESRLNLIFQSAQDAGIDYKSVGLSLYATSKSKAWLEQFVTGEKSHDDEKTEIEKSQPCSSAQCKHFEVLIIYWFFLKILRSVL